MLGEVPGMSLADPEFIGRCSWVGAMRYAVQRSGLDDFEIADAIGISHSYMSKVLKGTAGLHGQRLASFMRACRCCAPAQWIAHQVGGSLVLRDAQQVRIAALQAELLELQRGAA